MPTQTHDTQARPFIKWVGGKTQLLEEVHRVLPADIAFRRGLTYVEPFVGGGAVLFWILQQYPNIEHAVINDINPELICTYRVIKTDVEALISELSTLQREYLTLDADSRKEYFLDKRAQFNTKSTAPATTAALFIFLNRTCFNGLYRVNAKGLFNVPHGRYANPRVCDADNLRTVSRLLQKVDILCGDFANTGCYAGPDTLYYFDPPYKPITETSSFTSYSKDGFSDTEQIRLRDFCNQISEAGAMFIASNSDPKGHHIQPLLHQKSIRHQDDKLQPRRTRQHLRNHDIQRSKYLNRNERLQHLAPEFQGSNSRIQVLHRLREDIPQRGRHKSPALPDELTHRLS